MCSVTERRASIPVIYVKGTHYDVGYDIGRTFAKLISDHLNTNKFLNSDYIPLYETKQGRAIYEEALLAIKLKYPQYLRELQGIADGADVPFYKLFLIHLDDIILSAKEGTTNIGQGCSTMILNKNKQKIIGHTEDGIADALNNVYIVKVHITESTPNEVFTAFCYPGLLPGYAMGFNSRLAFTINIIATKYTAVGRIPRTFVTRALLTADSLSSVEEILRCTNGGIADSLSLNIMFLKNKVDGCKMYNIEVGPSFPPATHSVVNILEIKDGEHLFHCNRFLRINMPENEAAIKSSTERQHTAKLHPEPSTLKDVINLLGDCSSSEGCNIFRNGYKEIIKTLAVGVFDGEAKNWSIYLDNPKVADPIVVLPIH